MKKYPLYLIVAVVSLIISAISFLSIYFSISQHRSDLVKAAIKEKMHLAELVNETSASPLWIYHLALVPGMEKAFIKEMAEFKDVKYIRIVASDGAIYKSSREEDWGKIIKEPDINKVISTRQPLLKDQLFEGEEIKLIIYPGYQDKTVWVGFSLQAIKEAIKKIWLRDAVIMLGGLLLAILLLFIILKASVVDPIKKLALVCAKVAKGNLNVRVKASSKTEIGDLIKTFNQTLQKLKKSKELLEQAKMSLEIRVKARTRELEEVNQQLERRVEERTKDLQQRIEELERFHKLTVGRELKMIELKKELRKAKEKIEKSKGRK